MLAGRSLLFRGLVQAQLVEAVESADMVCSSQEMESSRLPERSTVEKWHTRLDGFTGCNTICAMAL